MGSFQQAGQLFRGNKRDVFRAATPDNHDFSVVRNLVEYGGKLLSKAGVSGLDRHTQSVQHSCTCVYSVFVSGNCASTLIRCPPAIGVLLLFTALFGVVAVSRFRWEAEG